MDAIDDELAAQTISNLLEYEKQVNVTRNEMYQKLNEVLPTVKLLKLYEAEMGFNKRLLSEFRRKKHANK